MQLSIYLSSFSSTCFELIRPSSGAMDVTISLHMQHMVSWWRVALQHATSTHTPQDRHLTTPRTPYAAYVKKL